MLYKTLNAKMAVIVAAALLCFSAFADDAKLPDLSRLQAALGGAKPDSVAEIAVPGLYEVVIGSQILYLSEEGRFAVQGEVIDLASATNITEQRRTKLRLSALEGIGEENMIVFEPDDAQAEHTVTVFTDIDCGYCRKLHSEISAYNDLGIRVRYLAFPRAGMKSKSYEKAVSVWCAEDPQDAMTRAKAGEDPPVKTCDNPVESQYNLGQQLGVRGTPSLILDNGEMVPGYVPAAQLADMFVH